MESVFEFKLRTQLNSFAHLLVPTPVQSLVPFTLQSTPDTLRSNNGAAEQRCPERAQAEQQLPDPFAKWKARPERHRLVVAGLHARQV